MALLPVRGILDGSSLPLTSAVKIAMGQVWDFLNAMLLAGSAAAPSVAVGGQDNGLYGNNGGVGVASGGVQRAFFGPGKNVIGEGGASVANFHAVRGECLSGLSYGVGVQNNVSFRTDGTKQAVVYGTQVTTVLLDDGSPRTFSSVQNERIMAPDISGLNAGSVVTAYYGKMHDVIPSPQILSAVQYFSLWNYIAGLDRWALKFTGTAPCWFGGDATFAGNVFNKQSAAAAVSATATLSTSAVTGRLITTVPTAATTLTLPDGASLDAALPSMSAHYAFDWSVLNVSGTFTSTLAAGTGHSVIGNMVVATNTSAAFRTRKIGTATYITYRIA